jgi:hypothetical protein
MKADTSEPGNPRGECDPAEFGVADVGSYELGAWDAPWPLVPAADEARELLVGRSRFVWLIVSLSLVALLGALLLAARLTGTLLPSVPQTPMVLGPWVPAADDEGA